MADEYETASDKLEAMVSGEYFEESTEDGKEDVTAEDEDTDQVEDSTDSEEEEIDTNEQIDGDAQETEESDEEDEEEEVEENTLVDDGNGEEPEADEVETKSETDSTEEKAEDVDPKAGEETVDYQKQYETLLADSQMTRNFYDRVTSEFQANGKTVKGFTDPDKIIQSQQMLHGFEDKMAVFKKHKPFLRALQEQGMVEDSTKFDLAMNIANGDKEAFKQHAQNQGWDLMDMDMDEVKYDQKPQTASKMELALDDVLEGASRNGVQDRMEQTLGKEWDSDSVVKLLDRPSDGAVLATHMQNGIYDAVQERISERLRTDVSGQFSGMDNYDRYKAASQELEREYQVYKGREAQTTKANAQAQARVAKEAEEKRIETGRVEAKYKADAAVNEKSANEARNKAVNASKPKNRTKKVRKTVDKMKLTGDAFSDYFNQEILGMH